MKKVTSIILRELQSFLLSPIAYIVFAAFLMITGYLFWVILVGSGLASLEPLLYYSAFILLLASPLITMRLISEEKKNRTMELLLTSPVSSWEIVIAKYIACMILYLILVVLTFHYPYILSQYSTDFDPGPVYSGYIGLILVMSAFTSVGIFASSLTENQIISAIITFGTLFMFWLFGMAKFALDNVLGDILGNLSIFDRFSVFLRGILDSGDVVFFVVFTFIWLFLAVKVLDSESWR